MPSSQGQTTRHALKVLGVLCQVSEPVSIAETARRLGMNTSVAHRALATLEATGFAERISYSSKYRAGQKTAILVSAFLEGYGLREPGIPVLRQLVLDTDEEAELFVRLGWYCVRLVSVEPPRRDVPVGYIGMTTPLHATMPGKALLATMPEAQIVRYFDFMDSHRIEVDRAGQGAALRDVAEALAAKGYVAGSEDEGDRRAGIVFPVRDEHGAVIAAINSHCRSGLGDLAVLDRLKTICEGLNNYLADDPGAAKTPLDHVPNDSIILPMDRPLT